jgi:2-polyprenyl-3-methyl-5-hydroxy-6-metoxy-1,4-benzoquinol methylase
MQKKENMKNQIPNYYKHTRSELSFFIPEGDNTVLDIGCAAGFFGENLKKIGKAANVFGIEGLENVAQEASQKLDLVKVADLESLDFDALKHEWNDVVFDYIVFGDVLEHLRDPWSILQASKCFLKPEGKIIISLPNVRHWSVILPLIFKGRWDYGPHGILDRTHFRFFTKATANDLVKKANLDVEHISVPIEGKKSKILSKISLGLLNELLGIQISVVAKKQNS